MKIMSRNFTTTEKILLVLLFVILVGLVYYHFVYVNLENSIASSNAESQSIQSELDVSQARLARLTKMKNELDTVMKGNNPSRMESYNNSKEEAAFLSDVLSNTKDYNIAFADVTRKGDQIRRSFTLKFRTESYEEAELIMMTISQSEYRCLIGDIKCNIADTEETTISMTATFFETMVGGIVDSGLPADEEKTENVSE